MSCTYRENISFDEGVRMINRKDYEYYTPNLAHCLSCGLVARTAVDLQSFQTPTRCRSCYNLMRTWSRAKKEFPHLIGITISPRLKIVGKYSNIHSFSRYKDNACKTCGLPYTYGNRHKFTLVPTLSPNSMRIECDSCSLSRLESKKTSNSTKVLSFVDKVKAEDAGSIYKLLMFQQSHSIFAPNINQKENL